MAHTPSKNALRELKSKLTPYVICVDVISNGLGSRGIIPADERETIEISAAVIDVKSGGRLIDEYSTFVRPVLRRELPKSVIAKTGIDQVLIDKAASFADVSHEFNMLIGRYGRDAAWCSWGTEDRQQIALDASRQKAQGILNMRRHINLKAWVAREFPAFKGLDMDVLMRMFGLEWRGMEGRSISEVRNLAAICRAILS